MFTKKDLRPYQKETWSKLDESLIDRGEKSTIMALPTGSGKTLTAVTWLNDRFLKHGCSCLWLVHRIELSDQARQAFTKAAPDIRTTEWNTNVKDQSGQVVIGMILSSRNLDRHFDVVVIDEAHHTAMPTYRRKLEELKPDFLLGLTATPTRLDGRSLGYESIATQYSVLDLVQDGYLSKPVYVRIRTGQRHRMRVGGGDFTNRSLRQLDNLSRNQLITRIWSEDRERWGKTLIFTADIQHADHLYASLYGRVDEIGLGPHSIAVVHSRLTQQVRDRRVRRFKEGHASVMINVGVFTEGFDVPDVRSIFLARPTASETLYLQMVGRGTRIAEGKDMFFVVDFVDELGKYSLLANRWAVQHLGAEDEVGRIEAQERVTRAEEVMQGANLPLRVIRNVLKEFVLFAGLLEYKTKFDTTPVVMAATEELYIAWQKLKVMLDDSDNAKATIERAYALAGASGTEMSLAQWKNLGWATFFDKIGQKHKGHVRFVEFRKMDLERELLKKEIEESRTWSDEVNKAFATDRSIEALHLSLNEELQWLFGTPQILAQLTYKDQIVTACTPWQRNAVKPSDRKQIRQTIVERVAEAADLNVELVLHWGKNYL